MISIARERPAYSPVLILSQRGEHADPTLTHPSAGGVTSGVQPLLLKAGGTWICAQSNTNKDSHSSLETPYSLVQIPVSPETFEGHYAETSNRGLWPLCHRAFVKPVFSRKNWESYLIANQLFASQAIRTSMDHPPQAILIQDYHLATCAAEIRKQWNTPPTHSRPCPPMSLFWHIPWPDSGTFSLFPWKSELLTGMLGADLIGFHTALDRDHFIQCCHLFLGREIDRSRSQVLQPGRKTQLLVHPISPAPPPEVAPSALSDRQPLLPTVLDPEDLLLLGVDRFDYTKGLSEKLQSLDRLLSTVNPSLLKKLYFLQIATPTRTGIPEFIRYQKECTQQIRALYEKHPTWMQTHFRWEERCLNKSELHLLYQRADLLWVNSLHDGLNLVAKEYLLARKQSKSALILSRYAGCAREFRHAHLINPFDCDETADTLQSAIQSLSQTESQERFKATQFQNLQNSALHWGYVLLQKTLDSGTENALTPSIDVRPIESGNFRMQAVRTTRSVS